MLNPTKTTCKGISIECYNDCMCGIAGILQFNGEKLEAPEIERMTHRLSHRGPDGQGTLLERNVALGHQRLSIIDPEGGRQPMSTPDQKLTITYNGELYNFRELRAELQSLGYSFQTRSDTEVILQSWAAWGKDCVTRFRGMFGFAVVDWQKKCIFLARDHFGIKPLFYTLSGDRFAFASEIQALRTLKGFSSELDLQAMDQYLFLSYIPAPKSIYKAVAKLAPAHRMLIHFNGRVEGPERYWRLKYKPRRWPSMDECAEALEAVIRESVRAHLVSDVRFGAFLSGGTDSSLVVSHMAQELDQPVRTFTIGFDDKEHSEVPYAKQASDRWGTEFHAKTVNPDALAILPRLAMHYGEPFGDLSAVPTYYVSKMAREHVPMVLSGDGGDELFAGYNSYLRWMQGLESSRPLWRTCWRHTLRHLRRDKFRRIPVRSLDFWQTCMYGRAFSDDRQSNLWRSEYMKFIDRPITPFTRAFGESRHYSALSQAQYIDTQTYLPNWILTKVDIASMMNSLEVRVPLLDVKVAEFAASIPAEYHLKKISGKGWDGKRTFKKVLSKYYPESFINRRKQGFLPPVHRWFKAGHPVRMECERRLNRRGANIHEFLDPSALKLVFEEVDRTNWGVALWTLLFLEEWLEIHHKH